MDIYYRSNPPLVVSTDPDAISVTRPAKYVENEEQTIRETMGATDTSAREREEKAFERVGGA